MTLSAWLRRAAVLAALGVVLAAASCGGGDGDCAGFISVNVTPAECARLAEQFGCTGFDVDGPSCGLTACATCEGL